MRIQSIGSLFKHVAEINHEGTPVIQSGMRWTEALRLEKKRLFGGKGEKPKKIAGRFYEVPKSRPYQILSEYHELDLNILESYGLDFRNNKPSIPANEMAKHLIRYVEALTRISIHEAALKKQILEKYYFIALCLVMRYAYDLTTRDTAKLFDIDREALENPIHNTRRKQFKVGKVVDCMKELVQIMEMKR